MKKLICFLKDYWEHKNRKIAEDTLGRLTYHHYSVIPIEEQPFYTIVKDKDFFNLGRSSTIAYLEDIMFVFGPEDDVKFDVGTIVIETWEQRGNDTLTDLWQIPRCHPRYDKEYVDYYGYVCDFFKKKRKNYYGEGDYSSNISLIFKCSGRKKKDFKTLPQLILGHVNWGYGDSIKYNLEEKEKLRIQPDLRYAIHKYDYIDPIYNHENGAILTGNWERKLQLHIQSQIMKDIQFGVREQSDLEKSEYLRLIGSRQQIIEALGSFKNVDKIDVIMEILNNFKKCLKNGSVESNQK